MPRTRGTLRSQAQKWAPRPTAEWREACQKWLELPADFGSPARHRLFPPATIFWLFLAQVLNPNGSCRETLRQFLAGRFVEQGKTASPNTAGYCRARGKLEPGPLARLNRQLARKIETAAGVWRWHGRAVKVVDGSGISMPDTPQNQAVWPPPAQSPAGCGFPVMRIVALFSLATGALLHWASGPLTVHERTLFRSLWRELKKGDVLLADRGFASWADFHFLSRRGVDAVMRKPARRKNAAVLRRFHAHDRLVEWRKSGLCPKWLDESLWRRMPERLAVREIRIQVAIPGFRTQNLEVVTTLLDPQAYPAADLAELYRRRWQVELFLRDLKITLGMDVLRCKTPKRIETELGMHLIAYNLIRALMTEAALTEDCPGERISFQGAVSTLRAWAPFLAQPRLDPKTRRDFYRLMLHDLVQDALPHRPNRTEPRARKRRPKNYRLLNKPRGEFREIPHRNKARKA